MRSRSHLSWLFAVLLAVAASYVHAGEQWLEDFDAAKKLAAEKGLPLLADFSGSDWCGWCIRLDREVFSRKAFKDYAEEHLVLFLADFPRRKEQSAETKKQNEQLAERYGVRGFQSVLLLDADGRVLSRTGYRQGGAGAYVEHLRELVSKHYAKAGDGEQSQQ